MKRAEFFGMIAGAVGLGKLLPEREKKEKDIFVSLNRAGLNRRIIMLIEKERMRIESGSPAAMAAGMALMALGSMLRSGCLTH